MAKEPATDPDIRKVRKVLRTATLPQGVSETDVELYEDWTGDPSIRIWLTIKDQLNPSDEYIAKLTEDIERLRTSILRAGVQRFPYIRLRAA